MIVVIISVFLIIWFTHKYLNDKKFSHFKYFTICFTLCLVCCFSIVVSADTQEETGDSLGFDTSLYPKVTVVYDKWDLARELGQIVETETQPNTTEGIMEETTYIDDTEGNEVIIDYFHHGVYYTYAPTTKADMTDDEYVETICRQLISYVMLNHDPPVLFNYVYLPNPVDNGDGTITYEECEIMRIDAGRVRLTVCVDATFQDDILVSIPKFHMKDWR